MRQIIPNLFIGDWDDVESSETSNTIQFVVTVCIEKPSLVPSKHFPLTDYGTMDKEYIDNVIEYIDEKREKGNVLVHCFLGKNRSASVIIAYLMYKRDMEFEEALEFVKQKKPDISPSNELRNQVIAYFDEL